MWYPGATVVICLLVWSKLKCQATLKLFAYVSLLNQLFYVIAWRLLHLHGNTETAFAFLACSDFIHISRGVPDLVEFIADLQIFTYFVLWINRLKISEIIQVGVFNPPSSLNGLRLGGETYSSLPFSINLTDPFFTFTFTRTCRNFLFIFFFLCVLLPP